MQFLSYIFWLFEFYRQMSHDCHVFCTHATLPFASWQRRMQRCRVSFRFSHTTGLSFIFFRDLSEGRTYAHGKNSFLFLHINRMKYFLEQ